MSRSLYALLIVEDVHVRLLPFLLRFDISAKEKLQIYRSRHSSAFSYFSLMPISTLMFQAFLDLVVIFSLTLNNEI